MLVFVPFFFANFGDSFASLEPSDGYGYIGLSPFVFMLVIIPFLIDNFGDSFASLEPSDGFRYIGLSPFVFVIVIVSLCFHASHCPLFHC